MGELDPSNSINAPILCYVEVADWGPRSAFAPWEFNCSIPTRVIVFWFEFIAVVPMDDFSVHFNFS